MILGAISCTQISSYCTFHPVQLSYECTCKNDGKFAFICVCFSLADVEIDKSSLRLKLQQSLLVFIQKVIIFEASVFFLFSINFMHYFGKVILAVVV